MISHRWCSIARCHGRSVHTALALAVASCALFSPVPAARAQTLTDLTLFRLDGNGNTIAEGWNMRGGDLISNLYLSSGGAVNSGNAAATAIALDFSAIGTYTFSFAGENVNGNVGPPLGLNLFFDGNPTNPLISARGTSGAGFVANGQTTSTPSFGTVAGANALAFSSGGHLITLSAFTYLTNSGADQVTSFNNAPGGTTDTTGSFTITVTGNATAAPEPSALALLAVGGAMSIATLRYGRKRRSS